MLLRNESRVIHTINIKLVFDDNRVREVILNECDQVQVSYRKNGCLRCGVGIIRNIKPYIHTKRWPFCKRESAVITLDMSEDFRVCVDKFDLFDIVDIRKVVTDDSSDTVITPDFPITGQCPCIPNPDDTTTPDTTPDTDVSQPETDTEPDNNTTETESTESETTENIEEV